MLRKIKRFLFSNWLYIITILIGLWFVYYLKLLKTKQFITDKEYISSFTTIIGWAIALLLGLMHLQKTRRDNRIAKKEEIRKALEINAFKEINKAVTEFSSILSTVATPYISLPGNLKLHLENPTLFKFNKAEVDMALRQKEIEIYKGAVGFVLAIESNEIAVIDLDHYRKYIQLRTEDLHTIIRDFLDYFGKLEIALLRSEDSFLEFKRKADDVFEKISDIQSFLFDYRIELMNSVLKEIFDKPVPGRKPRDPKYKTLKELAVKSEVEKETERRESEAMLGIKRK